MKNILEQIAAHTKRRVEEQNKKKPLNQVIKEANNLECNTGFPFEIAIKKEEISFICEIKKASPSKGIIDESFQYLEIAKEYEAIGASAISVITEPYWFKGNDECLKEIGKIVNIPLLRKDFTIDEYQIYESKILGASAVLLICSLLDTETLKKYIKLADNLGISCLVETHSKKEIESAILAGSRIIGINNRNLKTFEENIGKSIELRSNIPKDIIFVSESGIRNRHDIETLVGIDTDAVLIGETFMKSENRKAMMKMLKGEKA